MIYSNTRFTWSVGISLCSCLQFWGLNNMKNVKNVPKSHNSICTLNCIHFISLISLNLLFFFKLVSQFLCYYIYINNKLLRCCYCINQILLYVFYCDCLFAWFGHKQIVWKTENGNWNSKASSFGGRVPLLTVNLNNDLWCIIYIYTNISASAWVKDKGKERQSVWWPASEDWAQFNQSILDFQTYAAGHTGKVKVASDVAW